MQIVSLLSSATEMVCALGAAKQLVGRSHECDFPPEIESLPVCSVPLIDVGASSAEIDSAVKERLHRGLSIYELNTKLLGELKPDLILTQIQCEVCAVSLADVELALKEDLGFLPQIVSVNSQCLEDIWSDFIKIGVALGLEIKAKQLVSDLKQRINQQLSKVAGLLKKPKVFCIEWLDPLMAAGNWVPELVELAGGINIAGKSGVHSPWSSFSELAALDPDIIIIFPCGFDIKRTKEELSVVSEHPQWAGLRAVCNKKVFIADGNQYFNRPGPRIVESVEILTEILHPELVTPRLKGIGWDSVY